MKKNIEFINASFEKKPARVDRERNNNLYEEVYGIESDGDHQNEDPTKAGLCWDQS